MGRPYKKSGIVRRVIGLSDTRGYFAAQYILIFFFQLVFCVGVVQLALIVMGHRAVELAALRAAWAMPVVLGDCSKSYCGEPRNQLVSSLTATASDPSLRFANWLDQKAKSDGGGGCRSRSTVIRAAAANAFIPFASSLISGDGTASDMHKYLAGHLAVSFPSSPDTTSYKTSFGLTGVAYVRVTYVIPCTIPLAREVFCRPLTSLQKEAAEITRFAPHPWTGASSGLTHGFVTEFTAAVRNEGAQYVCPSGIESVLAEGGGSP